MAVSEIIERAVWTDGAIKSSGSELADWPIFLDMPTLGEASPYSVTCPTCGTDITVFIDTFAGNQCYFEDCTMCCRAIELRIEVSEYRVESVRGERPF